MPETLTIPSRIASLPVDPVRKIPVPWFVSWIDGKPEFRAADGAKWRIAVTERRCWVCGDKLGRFLTFVAGPMCGINRTSAEPPCHLDCARYSAVHCPFLSRPHMDRREGGLDQLPAGCPGHAILRNPGVTLLWTTKDYRFFGDGKGGILFRMGEPESTEWYAEGRAATRAEVTESIRTGLPFLEGMARQQEGAMEALTSMASAFERFYPEN